MALLAEAKFRQPELRQLRGVRPVPSAARTRRRCRHGSLGMPSALQAEGRHWRGQRRHRGLLLALANAPPYVLHVLLSRRIIAPVQAWPCRHCPCRRRASRLLRSPSFHAPPCTASCCWFARSRSYHAGSGVQRDCVTDLTERSLGMMRMQSAKRAAPTLTRAPLPAEGTVAPSQGRKLLKPSARLMQEKGGYAFVSVTTSLSSGRIWFVSASAKLADIT